MHRVRLVIRGRVQGVGFRGFAAREAGGLGVAGGVLNRSDGAVEVEAEGGLDQLARLLEALRAGPAGAHVTGIEEHWSEGPPRYREFRVRCERP